MPIPGSILTNFIVDKAQFIDLLDDVIYPSLATFYKRIKDVDTAGQETYSFEVILNAVDIPVRKSPLIQIRPQIQEFSTGFGVREDFKFQLNAVELVTGVEIDDYVVVDGISHRIVATEADGNSETCRFMLSDIVPFNG